jgi:hypothetical protein
LEFIHMQHFAQQLGQPSRSCESMKEQEAGACDAVKSKPLAKTKPDQQVQQQQRRASAGSSSWRRRSSSQDDRQPAGQDGELLQQRRKHLGRCIAGLALAVVLGMLCLRWVWKGQQSFRRQYGTVTDEASSWLCLLGLLLCCCRQAPSSKQDDGTSLSSIGAAGSYLRQIAALHDWESTASGVAQLQQDVQGVLAACAKQIILPEVKVGEKCDSKQGSWSASRSLRGAQAANIRATCTEKMSAPVLQVPQHIPHPAWFPPTGSLLPEIAALDLNCSLPAHAAACAQAAASNSYEGASIVLTSEEVAALLEVCPGTLSCAILLSLPLCAMLTRQDKSLGDSVTG